MPTVLHRQRLDAVLNALIETGARTVLDLGCGPGELLERLLREPRFRVVVGVDKSAEAIATARRRLAADPRLSLHHGSLIEYDKNLAGFDAVTMVETIEHIAPDRLSTVENVVFRRLAPGTVIVTTPNRDYNVILGVPSRRRRHRDHRFEWSRSRFRSWAEGVALRNGYGVCLSDLAGAHPVYGGASQMAVFTLEGRACLRGDDPAQRCISANEPLPSA